MRSTRFLTAGLAAFTTLIWFAQVATANGAVGSSRIKHVLLLSIDGMHAVDFYNCSHEISGTNRSNPYCPNLAKLGQRAINYVAAVSSKPSDSFPGLAALITGGSPKSTGLYYDVAYDRSLDAPATTSGTGLAGGTCLPYGLPTGTTTDYDQGIDLDDTKLNGGAPGACGDRRGVASIDPKKLVHEAGGYTAWIDKHPSYSMAAGPGSKGLNDYYSPEVSSNAIPLPAVITSQGVSCVRPFGMRVAVHGIAVSQTSSVTTR